MKLKNNIGTFIVALLLGACMIFGISKYANTKVTNFFQFSYYCPQCEQEIHIRPDLKHQCDNCGYKFVKYKSELTNEADSTILGNY